MKRVALFITVLLLASGFTHSMPQAEENIHLIRLNRKKPGVTPKSVFIPPVSAYLENGQLYVYFDTDMEAGITLVSWDNGSTVYSNHVSAAASSVLPVYIYMEEGEYEITITYGNEVLTGSFTI